MQMCAKNAFTNGINDCIDISFVQKRPPSCAKCNGKEKKIALRFWGYVLFTTYV